MLKLIFEKYKIFRGPDEELIPNGVICILGTKLPKRYSAVVKSITNLIRETSE